MVNQTKIAEYTTNILTHICFLVLFITIYFFTYGSYIESTVVQTQLTSIIDEVIGDTKTLYPSVIDYLKPYIVVIPEPDMQSEDSTVAANNSKIFTTAISAVAGSFIGTLVIIIFLIHYYKLNWKEILVSNIVSLIFVGLAYFIFTTLIIAKYKSIDSNYFKKSVLLSLKNN